MSDILRSLEPQPRWVYWLRRVLVGGAVVLVLVLVVALVKAIGGGDGGGAAAEGAEPTPSASESAPPDVTRPCEAADLQLALTSDASSYADGATPTFTVAVTNVGASSCTVDVGTTALEILVTSGSDRIWSSLDCAGEGAEGSERLLLLAEGAQEAAVVPWARVRSNATCDSGLPAPRPGTYHAVARLVGAESGDLVFTLG